MMLAAGVLCAASGIGVAAARHRAPDGSVSIDRRIWASLPQIDSSLRAIEDGDRETPRDTWDADYVVSLVGRDPQALFAWVRDNTFWIPYRGVLRGPVGVLMDRQGNSLDRALLLATLLEKAGHTTRLARGTLSRSQELELLPVLLMNRGMAFARARAYGSTALGLAAASARYGLDVAGVERGFAAQQNAMRGVASELQRRVADQTTRLLAAIPRADARDELRLRVASAVDALQDHWWVQQRVGDRWIDRDVERGDSASVLAVEDTLMLENLDAASLHHEIAVRVVTEQWDRGKLAEHRVLDQVLRPAKLFGTPIVLQLWPIDWINDSTSSTAPNAPVRADAPEQHIWVASLLTGDSTPKTAAILDDGRLLEDVAKGGPMASLASAFSRSLGSGGSSPDAELSAVWLEYEFRVPGEKPRIERRTVFDLIGAAARATGAPSLRVTEAMRVRRALAMTMRTELLPLAAQLSPEYVRHLVSESLLRNRSLFRAVGDATRGLDSTRVDSLLRQAQPALTPLYALAFARLAWRRNPGTIYIDRPGLLTRHVYPALVGDDLVLRDATDIVANDVGVSLLVRDGVRARVAQGVLDTNAEAQLALSGPAFGNAGDAFSSSPDWTTLSPNDPEHVGRLELPANVRARIAAALAEGYAVIAPRVPVPTHPRDFAGWWRIDPNTGQSLGFGEDGWGSSVTEESAHNARARLTAPKFFAAMKRFAAGFTSTYMWCLAAVSDPEIREQGFALGIKTGIVKSEQECVGDAIFVGALVSATWPLIAVSAEVGTMRAPRAPRVPPEPPPVRSPPARSCNGKGGGVPGEPVDPFGETVDLQKTIDDPGSAPPPPEPPAPYIKPANLIEAEQTVARALEDIRQMQPRHFNEYGEYIREVNKGLRGDPTYDPILEEALNDRVEANERESAEAWQRYRRAEKDYLETAKADREARQAAERERREKERAGSQQPPPSVSPAAQSVSPGAESIPPCEGARDIGLDKTVTGVNGLTKKSP